jgi:hypothetical protein
MSWTHTPRLPILIWAVWAFPFTLWDTTYIFLRPHTLPGRKWHEPFFRAMDSWAEVDHTYGEQAWQEREGFTAAQGVINMLEVTLYMVYFFIAWRHGRGGVRGAFGGRWAARAVLVGFAAGTVTATKTSLYCVLSPIPPSRCSADARSYARGFLGVQVYGTRPGTSHMDVVGLHEVRACSHQLLQGQ